MNILPKSLISAAALVAFSASNVSAQVIVQEFNFVSNTEGWTTAGTDPYTSFGQQTATGGTEGVLFGIQSSGTASV